jgi:hypothetical protein
VYRIVIERRSNPDNVLLDVLLELSNKGSLTPVIMWVQVALGGKYNIVKPPLHITTSCKMEMNHKEPQVNKDKVSAPLK